jgi:hypothetical protein
MKITNFDTHVVLEDEKNDLKAFSDFLRYQMEKKFRGQNVVIDLSRNSELDLDQLLYFLPVSNLHRGNDSSFVILNNAINPDDIPQEIIVVPTMIEARDIIEMEEIERNLGF